MLTDPAADPALRRGAQSTLLDVLAAVLKLLHPLMPFVTEELWLELAKQRGWASATLMLERFPEPQDVTADAAAEQEIEWLKGFVGGIRQLRGEDQSAAVGEADVRCWLMRATSTVRARSVTRVSCASWPASNASTSFRKAVGSKAPPPPCSAPCGSSCRLAGLIDVAAERDRLGKQLEKTHDDLGKVQRKLDNQGFVANAPPEIVAKEYTRIAELTQRATQLEQQLARLAESSRTHQNGSGVGDVGPNPNASCACRCELRYSGLLGHPLFMNDLVTSER